jgi:hypothetical protein
VAAPAPTCDAETQTETTKKDGKGKQLLFPKADARGPKAKSSAHYKKELIERQKKIAKEIEDKKTDKGAHRRALDGRKARVREKEDMEALQHALQCLRVRFGLYKHIENRPKVFTERDIQIFLKAGFTWD